MSAGPGNDNEGPRPTTAADVFGVGQATFYETRKIIPLGRNGQTDNKCSGRMTASDVVPFREAASYETRKIVGRYQLTRRDNKGAYGRTAAVFVAPEEASLYESGNVLGLSPGQVSDNKSARRTKRRESSAPGGGAGMRTTGRVVQRPQKLSLGGRPRG